MGQPLSVAEVARARRIRYGEKGRPKRRGREQESAAGSCEISSGSHATSSQESVLLSRSRAMVPNPQDVCLFLQLSMYTGAGRKEK